MPVQTRSRAAGQPLLSLSSPPKRHRATEPPPPPVPPSSHLINPLTGLRYALTPWSGNSGLVPGQNDLEPPSGRMQLPFALDNSDIPDCFSLGQPLDEFCYWEKEFKEEQEKKRKKGRETRRKRNGGLKGVGRRKKFKKESRERGGRKVCEEGGGGGGARYRDGFE